MKWLLAATLVLGTLSVAALDHLPAPDFAGAAEMMSGRPHIEQHGMVAIYTTPSKKLTLALAN